MTEVQEGAAPPKGVADHPAKDLMQDLWLQGKRAAEIVQELEDRDLPPVKRSTIARYGQRFWSDPEHATTTFESDFVSAKGLEQTLAMAQGLGDVRKVSVINKQFPGWEKIDGENVQVDKFSATQSIEFTPRETVDFLSDIKPIVNPRPLKIVDAPKKAKPKGFNLLVDFPDSQMGYFRDADGSMIPIHDESAIDVSLQILGYLEWSEGVDVIVNQGDDLDFAEFSSHRSAPGYKGHLQANLSRHTSHLATQREIASSAEIIQLWGNHESRLEKFLVDKAPDLLGVCVVDTDMPVLSVANLCRYDDYGITWDLPYPHGSYWANDYLRFTHGTTSSGIPARAASKSLTDAPGISVVYGHDHYQALARDRVLTREGMREVFSASAGCLCRTDGLVPSSSSGIGANGKATAKERWQQGILIIYFEPENLQRAIVEPVHISNGSAVFRGITFESTVDSDGNPNGQR